VLWAVGAGAPSSPLPQAGADGLRSERELWLTVAINTLPKIKSDKYVLNPDRVVYMRQ